ncbi:hypothetical protein Ddye_015713 [Dipteronia dyeriana]|uniref:Uncharacterized protein n=1 Tax=Dipteronia dyeriana TaxID=168575 RepID=A0AAD9WY61_9ROSI|nr:hypothetical protein Ddye_015713 [Dipteronia dyeriana]
MRIGEEKIGRRRKEEEEKGKRKSTTNDDEEEVINDEVKNANKSKSSYLKMSDAIPNSSASIGTPVANSNTVETENDQAPLWKVKCHLLKLKGNGIASCTKVTNTNLLEMQRVVDEAELRVKQSIPRPVPLPSGIGSSSASPSISYRLDPKKRKRVSGAIEKAFNIGVR